jgi:hypothetical protein
MMKKSTAKLNCWEVKRCGREPEGKRIDLGVCPASREIRFNGMHGGAKPGGVGCGRHCAASAGDLRKYDTCDSVISLTRKTGEGADISAPSFSSAS